MSSPLDRNFERDEPSPYAPKWVRDAHQAKWKGASTNFENREEKADCRSALPSAASDEGVVIERFRLPRSLEPTLMPEPALESRSLVRLMWGLALAVGVAAAVAFAVVGKPWTGGVVKGGEDPNSFLPRFVGQRSVSAERPSRPTPKLVAGQATPRRTGEAFPLGVSIRGPGDDALLVVAGLANGAALSAGQPAGDDNWRISTAQLDDLMIQPPRDFVGAMDLTVELRLADETVADRRSLRFEWAAPAVPEAKPKEFVVHPLDPDESAMLLKRGNELIASGDLAAARLVLQRVAEAGDARGALALAGTYDPMVLEKLAVHGFAPDVAMARSWYEKAQQFGSADAPRRLEMLASRRE
jgi:hypothetical protein